MKQRLLTISVNSRYRVIFPCLYWKSQVISCSLENGHPVNLVTVNHSAVAMVTREQKHHNNLSCKTAEINMNYSLIRTVVPYSHHQ